MMKSSGLADLHVHTIMSDGFLSPTELLVKLRNSAISTVAITDHDSIAALDAARRKASIFNIRTISGVELSAEFNGMDLHFLGYFINYHNKRFLDYLYLFRRRRHQRAQEMIERLEKIGVHITIDRVVEIARNGPIGRPHLADILIKGGWAESRDDAFEKYLRDDGPIHVEKYCITAQEVIDLIHSIGGAAFLAHPGISCTDKTIRELVTLGLDGLEVVHPKHTSEMVGYYSALAGELSLLKSGGSDYHGDPDSDEELGAYCIKEEEVELIKDYCESKNEEWIQMYGGMEENAYESRIHEDRK